MVVLPFSFPGDSHSQTIVCTVCNKIVLCCAMPVVNMSRHRNKTRGVADRSSLTFVSERGRGSDDWLDVEEEVKPIPTNRSNPRTLPNINHFLNPPTSWGKKSIYYKERKTHPVRANPGFKATHQPYSVHLLPRQNNKRSSSPLCC